MASEKTFLKIVKHNGTVHILQDNRQNREFHDRYTRHAPKEDKYKTIEVVTGRFIVNKETGGQEFEQSGVKEEIYSNLSVADGRAAAAESENEALREQIALLQEQLAAKGTKSVKGNAKKKGEEGGEAEDE